MGKAVDKAGSPDDFQPSQLLRPASKSLSAGDHLCTEQTAWMNPSLRRWLIATRPWSFPASLVPVALAGAATHRLHGTDLMSLDFILVTLLILLTHAAANLCNTYFDFKNGVDTENADDRALVDATVDAAALMKLSLALFAAAAVLLARFSLSVGPAFAYIAGPGLILAVGYTATPINLKAKGLSDVVIFLCFGPLLVLAVYLAIAGDAVSLEGSLTQLALSIPIGLLTDAILHANNTRDIVTDKAANVLTVAQVSHCPS